MRQERKTPLIVDVDFSLLRTDMLFECFWSALGRAPFATILAVLMTLHSRAQLKRRLALLAKIDISLLPINQDVVDLIAQARAEGRAVYFASGGDELVVKALAKHLDLSDHHFSSNGVVDMTAQNKARTLVRWFESGGFSYVGDRMADVPVWEEADKVYVVGDSPAVAQAVKRLKKEVIFLGGGWHMLDLLRSMRMYQYIKNALLLLPILAAQRTDIYSFTNVFLGVIAFSMVASSIYIANDLFDLDSDRRHAFKKNRPFASGAVPIPVGMLAGALLGLLGLLIAGSMGRDVFAVFIAYIVLSFAYSMGLKRIRWVDIVILTALYTIRVIAGAEAANIPVSLWLLAFIIPVFLSLSAVKRMTELARTSRSTALPGRGYTRADRSNLFFLARSMAVIAVLMFVIYTFSETALSLYTGIWELRWCAIPVSVWLYRMIYTALDGKQDYDPISFAIRDRVSLMLCAVTVLGLYNAAAVPIPKFW